MTTARLIRDTLAEGRGILRLMPVFVPRRFSAPGRRLRLHPDDYFALGTNRGAIKERWFASVIRCMNGPLAAKDEGLSYVLPKAGPAKEVTLKDAQMDWEKNIDPHYARHYARPPIRCPHSDDRHTEKWISYANPYVGAKELTVRPGQTVTVKDGAAYGCIVIQGHGTFGGFRCEAAGMLRFGQLTADEFFVSEPAAKAGVTITGESQYEPLVILKHFGPNHPEMPKAAALGLRE